MKHRLEIGPIVMLVAVLITRLVGVVVAAVAMVMYGTVILALLLGSMPARLVRRSPVVFPVRR